MIRILFALLLLGTAARAASPDQSLIEAARKEGTVVWYSTLIVNQIVRPMVEKFQAKYPGIEVKYSRAGGSDTALKIINEARARRGAADVFDGSSTLVPLIEAGLVASYKPREAEDYPDSLKDKNGLWTVPNLFFLTAGYNTSLVKPEDRPKTWGDLLNPRWKGHIAWTNDLSSGGPPGFVHHILSVFGEEKGRDYLRSFNLQEPVTIPAAQRVVLDKVIAGEYPLGLMIFNYHAAISAEQGAPVGWLKLEPLIQTMNTVSVVKDSPHPNAARLLVEFMLSDEGQRVMADNNYMPAKPSVPARIAELKPEAGHFTVKLMTPDDVRENLSRWTALYHELFR